MLRAWVGRLALHYCREILYCEREAAIVARNTLKMGRNGMIPLEQAVDRTVSSLEIQIRALESLMGLSSDD
ncbi:MAG: hypothetical protein ACRC62_26035 [Microcoleus sp.]